MAKDWNLVDTKICVVLMSLKFMTNSELLQFQASERARIKEKLEKEMGQAKSLESSESHDICCASL